MSLHLFLEEKVRIRSLEEQDLDRITEIAQRGLEFDSVSKPLIREKTLGALDFNPALTAVVEVDGIVTAFAQGAMGQMEKNKAVGFVRLMVVDRPYRMQGIGTRLLIEMEQRLKAAGAAAIQIYDCPHNYFQPGVDFRYTEAYCFLQKHKYEMYRENHNLVCDLDVNAWPSLDGDAATMKEQGIEIRRARPDDKEAVDAFLAEHWPAWKFEVHAALRNNPVSLHLGFMDGKVVAFSGHQGNNGALPWFGPMGTSPVLRGKGVGGILLRLCLRDLARQGWRSAVIPWVGPTRFYARYCGARLDRCFWAYRKTL